MEIQSKVWICSKLTIKIPELRQCRRSGFFIVNFGDTSKFLLVFLLLTLNRPRLIGVFFLLTFLLTLNRYFCFSYEKSNYFYRNRLSYLFLFSLLKERYQCIYSVICCFAHNTYYPLLCCVFQLTLWRSVTRCAGHNIDLPSNSNISRTVRVNIVFNKQFLKSVW